MSIWKSSAKNQNNILLRVTNLPGDFARTHALGAEMCFVAPNLYIFVCSGFNNNEKIIMVKKSVSSGKLLNCKNVCNLYFSC